MGLGLYKPGQGYWVRVMTAAFSGIIVLIACAWMWNMLGGVQLPTPTWSMNVVPEKGKTAIGDAAAGQTVIFLGESSEPDKPGPEVGTGEVVSLKPGTTGQQLIVRKVEFKPGQSGAQIQSVAPAPGSKATLSGKLSGSAQGQPIFEALYLQAAGVSVLILVGGVLVFWLVGSKQSSVEFLIATDGEMKKVNWSSKKDIIGSTQVVIMWCVLLVVGLFFVDLAFSSFFRLIHVLQDK